MALLLPIYTTTLWVVRSHPRLRSALTGHQSGNKVLHSTGTQCEHLLSALRDSSLSLNTYVWASVGWRLPFWQRWTPSGAVVAFSAMTPSTKCTSFICQEHKYIT